MDTGSTDGTPQVARSLGAKTYEVGERFMETISAEEAEEINRRFVVAGEEPIVHAGSRLFNFSAARNYCASLASCDWVCWADSDEEFTALDIDEINRIISDPDLTHLEYEFVYAHDAEGRPAVQFIQSKMYRREGPPGKRMRWRGIVHEVLEHY